MAERSQTIRSFLVRHESDTGFREAAAVAAWSGSERSSGLSVEWEGSDAHDATVAPGVAQDRSDPGLSYPCASLPEDLQTLLSGQEERNQSCES